MILDIRNIAVRSGCIAKALVVNDEGKVLVLTIGEHTKHPQLSYMPDLPGGIIEKDETPLNGVQREIEEEIGVRIPLSDIHELYSHTRKYAIFGYRLTRMLYLARVSKPEVKLSYEHESYKWTLPDELWHVKFSGLYYDGFIEHALYKLQLEGLLPG